MSVALASTWRPRGELARFQRLFPQLEGVYASIVISSPPDVEQETVEAIEAFPGVAFYRSPEWSWGRHVALQRALEADVTHIQYADFDRLLRWVETRPEEWGAILQAIQKSDCLLIGRTQTAYSTHPQALVQTEALSNLVTSFLLGQEVDVSAGSKGFSRQAAEFLVANSLPGHALGTDAEWPVLLQRAGFKIDYVAVEGLDWESADHFREQAADSERQHQEAEIYDRDPAHWARRVEVAMEIIQCGLEATQRIVSWEIPKAQN